MSSKNPSEYNEFIDVHPVRNWLMASAAFAVVAAGITLAAEAIDQPHDTPATVQTDR